MRTQLRIGKDRSGLGLDVIHDGKLWIAVDEQGLAQDSGYDCPPVDKDIPLTIQDFANRPLMAHNVLVFWPSLYTQDLTVEVPR